MRIVLYGATGYTGALVADELERRGVDHVLSGRDPAKLVRLGDQRGVPARAATLDDEPGLRGLLDEASAVINCAGPFTLSGDALLRAAIDTGTHYVDSTGEQAFIRLVFVVTAPPPRMPESLWCRRSASTTRRATALPVWRPGTSRSRSWCSPMPCRGSA
jgi:saccharopine dehydrogenase-like NADP-dependent oxidoreductase